MKREDLFRICNIIIEMAIAASIRRDEEKARRYFNSAVACYAYVYVIGRIQKVFPRAGMDVCINSPYLIAQPLLVSIRADSPYLVALPTLMNIDISIPYFIAQSTLLSVHIASPFFAAQPTLLKCTVYTTYTEIPSQS